MKTVIYYFTGTGNSLAAAKQVASILRDCTLVPIAPLTDTPGEIAPGGDRIGIVFPVYFVGLPAMVAAFAARLRLEKRQYVFAIATFGGTGAVPALRQLDGILRQHATRGIDAGFRVKMPGNYILMYESPQGKKQDALLAAASAEIAKIAEVVRDCHGQDLPRSIFGQLIHALVYGRFISRVHEKDRAFSVTERCTGCGTCAGVCPAHNIRLVQDRPVWQHRCELCCACIHTCPVQAIQAGAGTEKRQRYRNPDVTIGELKLKKENTP